MKSLDRVRQLVTTTLAADGRQAPAGFTEDELGKLEAACGHALPGELKSLLTTADVFDFSVEVFVEDVGYFVFTPPETLIADAAQLRSTAEDSDWELPRCCGLSLLNNEFIAYDLDKSTVIHINGDDGEVTELGQGLDAFFEKVADAWPSA